MSSTSEPALSRAEQNERYFHEFEHEHQRSGRPVEVEPGGGKWLYPSGAVIHRSPVGQPVACFVPPGEEHKLLEMQALYWQLRVTRGEGYFRASKFALDPASDVFTPPKWPNFWPRPSATNDPVELLTVIRDHVRADRKQLAKAEKAYEGHPEIQAKRERERRTQEAQAATEEIEMELAGRIRGVKL
jgi:hypothetical protein